MDEQTQLLIEIRDGINKLIQQTEQNQAVYHEAVDRQLQIEERMLAARKPLLMFGALCLMALGAAIALLLLNRLGL